MNTLTSSHASKSRSAFTLIEIMVATVIMVVLVGLVIQITSEVLKVWNRSSGKLSANAEARIAMDLLTQDLETAVFRNNEQQWLRVDAPRQTEEGGTGLYTDQTVALKLFTPALDRPKKYVAGDVIPAGSAVGDDIPGDICAVGYRLAYKNTYGSTTGPEVYALYRKVVNSQATFADYMGSPSDTDSPQLSLDENSTADWSEFGAGSITDDANYLVGNIVEFKILVYEDDGTSTDLDALNVDATSGELTTTYAYGGTNATLIGTKPLCYADIILTVISDEGLKKMENLGKTPETPAEIVLQYGEIYTRRVNFLARPL